MPEHASPETAIDGVSGPVALLTDQHGQSRFQGLGVDVGAVERQPTDNDWAPWLWRPLLRGPG